jgi:hypothetical protein
MLKLPETFLPFDLESVFVSTVILLIGPAIDPRLLESHPSWLEKAYAIFDEMIGDGNQVATFRRSELQQLDETLLGCISGSQSGPLTIPAFYSQPGIVPHPSSPSTSVSGSIPHPVRYDTLLRPDHDLDAECDFGTMLTSAEIMAVADSIETFDTEWVSNAMIEHSIW